MPLDAYKRNLLREAQNNNNTVTLFYKKRNQDRVRREIEPYEISTEKTKSGVKTFLYGIDVSVVTPREKRTIKKFDVEEIGVVIVNKGKNFFPKYNMVPIE